MKVAIWGAAGTIGHSIAEALAARSIAYRVVGRSLDKLSDYPNDASVERVVADLTTAEGCAKAAAGVDAICYTLGLPYTQKAFSAYPGMMQLATAAARQASVKRLLHVSNVYPYGRPQTPRVSESHPLLPCAVKGRYRKEQEDAALGGHQPGALETLVLRLPDFYGPRAENSLAHVIFAAAVAGKKADTFGPIDTPHEFVYTPDVGPVVTALLSQPTGWGTAYNFAGVAPTTVRAFATQVYRAVDKPPALRVLPPWAVRALGVFMPILRELGEMSYLQTHPVLLDDQKLTALLGKLSKTSYEEGIRRTIAALQPSMAAAASA